MLAKMGFKPGSSLGKAGTGITEPVGINIKGKKRNWHTGPVDIDVDVDVLMILLLLLLLLL